MNRIDPINPLSQEVQPIAAVYRRESEQESGPGRKRKQAPQPSQQESDEPMAHHFVDEHGEHVDARA